MVGEEEEGLRREEIRAFKHWLHKFKSAIQLAGILQPSCDLVFPDEWREAVEGERK